MEAEEDVMFSTAANIKYSYFDQFKLYNVPWIAIELIMNSLQNILKEGCNKTCILISDCSMDKCFCGIDV